MGINLPASTSHVNPSGQQCLRSSQQTALFKGQQPYMPEERLEQVLFFGHWYLFSGLILPSGRFVVAGTWNR